MRALAIVLATSAAAVAVWAQARGPSEHGALPLVRLVVYSTGVAYHERRGVLPAGGVAEIPLEPGQLDDVLKTAVVLSEDGVSAIEFVPPESREASFAEAGLDLDAAAAPGFAGILAALEGAEVEVQRRGGDPVSGRLIGLEAARSGETGEAGVAEEPEEGEGAAETEQDPTGGELASIAVFGARGLVRVLLRDVIAVLPRERSRADALGRAVAASSPFPARSVVRVRGGASGGRVAVGYTTEAAVWRTTYRLLLRNAGSRVQGFALVHNNTDEAWSDLEVSLVSGRPRSFLFPLAVPRFARRDLVSPEDGLDVAPQLLTGDARDHLLGGLLSESHGIGGLGTVGYGSGGGGSGFVEHELRSGGRGVSELSIEGPSPLAAAAVSEAGDLFAYTVARPVTLPARTSALLPIVESAILAERADVVDADGAAYSGVRLVNDTELTLEAGTTAVFGDGSFLGETELSRTKPKEVRVLTFGEVLDVEVERTLRRERGPALAVRVRASVPYVEGMERVSHELRVTSRSDRPRTLLVSLEAEGYRVTSGAEEDVRSPGQPRYARLQLGPREVSSATIVEERASARRFDVTEPEVIDGLIETGGLDEAARARLLAARVGAVEAQAALAIIAAQTKRIEVLIADAARLREGLEASGRGGSRGAFDAFAMKLVKNEENVELAKRRKDDAEQQLAEARARALEALED